MNYKNVKSLFVIVVIAAIYSCSGGAANEPVNVTKQFFNAIKATNFEEAQKFATKDSKMTLQLAQIAMNFSGKNKDTVMTEFDRHNFEYSKPVINGEEAMVTVSIDKKQKIDFTLRKEDGMWKMALDLNTLMKMGMANKERDSIPTEDMNDIKKTIEALDNDTTSI